jgi:hypothetical protein
MSWWYMDMFSSLTHLIKWTCEVYICIRAQQQEGKKDELCTSQTHRIHQTQHIPSWPIWCASWMYSSLCVREINAFLSTCMLEFKKSPSQAYIPSRESKNCRVSSWARNDSKKKLSLSSMGSKLGSFSSYACLSDLAILHFIYTVSSEFFESSL